MSAEEQTTLGDFAGQQVTTGPQAEAFARYIAGHLQEVNGGKTYSETSAAARAEGLPADQAAALQAKADTLFKGETLRSIMLNAYGWWTVATIALWAGYVMVAAGIVLLILSILGFRHATRAAADVATVETSTAGRDGLGSRPSRRYRRQRSGARLSSRPLATAVPAHISWRRLIRSSIGGWVEKSFSIRLVSGPGTREGWSSHRCAVALFAERIAWGASRIFSSALISPGG